MSPNPFAAQFNTGLSPQEEANFQQWRARLPRNLQNIDDYDLRGAWRANAQEAGNGHLPDTWKKPNHPTFSAESQYSGKQQTGGNWVETPDGKWIFFASPDNLKYRSGAQLQNYFRDVEPGSRLVPPVNNMFRR
jgi:hypothetical protein